MWYTGRVSMAAAFLFVNYDYIDFCEISFSDCWGLSQTNTLSEG